MSADSMPSIRIETALSAADIERVADAVALRLLADATTGDAILTTEQAADLLQCANSQLRVWVRDAGCPVLRLDGKFRFLRSQLLTWAASHAESERAEPSGA